MFSNWYKISNETCSEISSLYEISIIYNNTRTLYKTSINMHIFSKAQLSGVVVSLVISLSLKYTHMYLPTHNSACLANFIKYVPSCDFSQNLFTSFMSLKCSKKHRENNEVYFSCIVYNGAITHLRLHMTEDCVLPSNRILMEETIGVMKFESLVCGPSPPKKMWSKMSIHAYLYFKFWYNNN